MISPLLRTIVIALLMAAAASAASPAQAAKGKDVTCRYAESGAPGPEGNELRIKVLVDERGVSLGRGGSEIWVRAVKLDEEGAHSSGGAAGAAAAAASVQRQSATLARRGRPSRTLTCKGGVPTVSNLDAIKVTLNKRAYEAPVVINLRAGELAPGATDEGDGGSEIETTVQRSSFLSQGEYGYESPLVFVRGSAGADSYSIGPALTGFEADLDASDENADIDLLTGTIPTYFLMRGGDDTLVAEGAPFESFIPVGALAGSGDDTVKASGGLVFALGGPGADTLEGGPGFSFLLGGRGDDLFLGGNGPDYLIGGGGRDDMNGRGSGDFLSAADGERDKVVCGRGRDFTVVDSKDRPQGCERKQRSR